MSKDPIADFLKGTIAILGVIEKGAKAAEKNSRKRAKRTNTRTKTQYIKTILPLEKAPKDLTKEDKIAIGIMLFIIFIIVLGQILSMVYQ